MASHEERMAQRAAERKALEVKLDHEEAERQAAPADPTLIAVSRQEGSVLRSAAVLIGIVLLAVVLIGSCITLIRMSGRDFGDAERVGTAAVDACARQGPVTNQGFGYWDSCVVTIVWDGGSTDRLIANAEFTSADIGTRVRVGDVGKHRTTIKLARQDTPARPWLAWIGYLVGIVGVVPGLVAVLIIRELLRFRRR